jgi:tripartite-type tricarboxylate transporter receptor subunit TctC
MTKRLINGDHALGTEKETRMRALLSGILTLTCLAGGGALAQDKFPSRPVTILLGYPPGGSTDTTARALAPVLERILGQPVVIQNRPGAAALIGTQAVANAAPDGYTVTVATTQLALLPAVDRVFGRPPSFTRDQFAPIALISADPSLIFANANQPWKTFQELVADAKRRPGQIVYASGGLYGTTHLAIEIVLKATGIKMRHLPTAGGGPALTAVLGNHAALFAAHPVVGGPQARAGALRPLGTMGTKRVASFSDVPTLKELGYDAEYYQWNGLFTQAKVPEPIITIWREAVARAVTDPEFVQAMGRVGSGIQYMDRDAFRAWWDQDSKKIEEAVQAIGRVQ